MVYRYKCKDCKNYITLLIKDDICPICGGSLISMDKMESILNPDSVIIQHIYMMDGRQVLVIDGRENIRAFELQNLDWQPIPAIDIFKPYGHIIKAKGRIF